MDEEKEEKNSKLLFKEIVKTILIVSVLVVVVRFFVIQPFVVKGTSMEPNYHDSEYIFVEELSTRIFGFKRGDVVIFKHPEPICNNFLEKSVINRIFFQGPCINYIKRVVGLPGETIIIKDGQVKIKNKQHSDGFLLDESYIPKTASYKLLGDMTKTLGKDEYFVLGDNRQPNASLDSREWGPLPKDHITGKAWLRVLPINDMGFIFRPKYKI